MQTVPACNSVLTHRIKAHWLQEKNFLPFEEAIQFLGMLIFSHLFLLPLIKLQLHLPVGWFVNDLYRVEEQELGIAFWRVEG